MADDFYPIARLPIEYYTAEIPRLKREQEQLEKELKELKQQKYPKKGTKEREAFIAKLETLEVKIATISRERSKLVSELEHKLEYSDGRSADNAEDTPKLFNECIGYAYGKCIYVDSNGAVRYREAEEHEAEQIGETAFADVPLQLISELPEGERKMIFRYLDEHPDTPEWFKKRND